MITSNAGNEGFKWFIGIVEDRDDPQKLGRVRVRIYNVHSESKAFVPTDSLPWATPLLPTTSAGLNQVGASPTGMMVGTTVFGFFLDGNEATLPVLFGVLAGVGDVSKLAQEQNNIEKESIGPEPPSAFAAKYPYNKVTRTEGGHVIEIDDTPNSKRIHFYHSAGTYVEINQEGNKVEKIVGDSFEIDMGKKTILIQKDMDVTVKGSYNVKVESDMNVQVSGTLSLKGSKVVINDGTKGAAREGDPADTADPGAAEGTNKIDSGSGTVFIGD
jgi:hypothetical protein